MESRIFDHVYTVAITVLYGATIGSGLYMIAIFG